jgi:hypothetical protein
VVAVVSGFWRGPKLEREAGLKPAWNSLEGCRLVSRLFPRFLWADFPDEDFRLVVALSIRLVDPPGRKGYPQCVPCGEVHMLNWLPEAINGE